MSTTQAVNESELLSTVRVEVLNLIVEIRKSNDISFTNKADAIHRLAEAYGYMKAPGKPAGIRT